MNDFKNNENEIKFANWNQGYEDIFAEIREIREKVELAMFDMKNKSGMLTVLYSRVKGLFLTHGHYVITQQEIQKKLDDIHTILFSDRYKYAVKENINSQEQHNIMLSALEKIIQQICESFSKNGLTMKIIIKKRKASMKEGLTEEEKEELEALEEVGIM